MAKSSKKKRPVAKIEAPSQVGEAIKPRRKAVGKAVVSRVSKVRPEPVAGEADRLSRLLAAIGSVGTGRQKSPRTQKLLAGGVPKMAQKLIEEAAEAAIDAVRGERTGLINESADLLFNLVVLWSALGVTPDDVWAEMDRREKLLGMAEKLPKAGDGGSA